MKNKKNIICFIMVFTFSVFLVGCGSGSNEANSNNASTDEVNTDQPSVERVSLAAAGTGGAWYPIGGGMANLVNMQSDFLEMSAEVTSGGVENMRFVNGNLNQFAFANTDIAFAAHAGDEPYQDEGNLDILGMFYLYPSTFQVVVPTDSGIESIGDLKGKKVVVGPPASSSAIMGWNILKHYGITEKDITGLTISFAEGADLLRDGNADALFVMSAHPNSSIMDLSTSRDITLLSVEKEVMNKVVEEFKYYAESVIPAGTYEGQAEDIETLSLGTMIVANSSVSDDVAYEFTRIIFDNLEEVHEFHAVARQIELDKAGQSPIPFHPGAKKYFEEKGIEISE